LYSGDPVPAAETHNGDDGRSAAAKPRGRSTATKENHCIDDNKQVCLHLDLFLSAIYTYSSGTVENLVKIVK